MNFVIFKSRIEEILVFMTFFDFLITLQQRSLHTASGTSTVMEEIPVIILPLLTAVRLAKIILLIRIFRTRLEQIEKFRIVNSIE